MNDSISVTLATTVPSGPFSGTAAGINGAGAAGLNGLFGQLLAISMPPASASQGNGQPLPMNGMALPLNLPEAGQQLASVLERFAGGLIPEDYLTQLRQQGITRESLTELADMLESSDIAAMPAIDSLVSEIRSALQRLPEPDVTADDLADADAEGAGLGVENDAAHPQPQPPASDGDELEAGARPGGELQRVSTDSVQMEAGSRNSVSPSMGIPEGPAPQANEGSSQSAENSTGQAGNGRGAQAVEAVFRSAEPVSSNAESSAKAAPSANVDKVADPAVVSPAQASAVRAETVAVSSASAGTDLQPVRPLSVQSEGAAKSTGGGATAEVSSGADSSAARTGGGARASNERQADASLGTTGSSRDDGRSPQQDRQLVTPQGQRILNAELAELAQQRQQQAARATGTLQSEAEQLMSRLTDAADKGRSGTAAGVLQGLALSDSRAAQVAQGRSATPLDSLGFMAATARGALESVQGVLSQPQTQPQAQPQPQGQPQAVSSVPQDVVDVGATATGVRPPSAEADVVAQARREPTQLVSPEVRNASDSGTRQGGPGFAVTPVVDTDGASSDLTRDGGGRDDGRGREGGSQQAAAQGAVTRAEQQGQQAPHQLYMAGRPSLNSPAWPSTLGNQIVWLASQNNKVAEIQLDPPELGSLQVKIRVSQDQVSVSFVSPHAAVRDTVEQSMARLREMFEEQGLNLAEATVDDQSAQQHAGGEMSDGQHGQGAGQSGAGGDVEEVQLVEGHTVSLVDYYA